MKNFEHLVEQSFDIMHIEISKKDKDSGENIKLAVKNYYEVLIYNVVSIAVVIALANDAKKLLPSHIEHVKDYIKTKCKVKGDKNIQTGGTSLPAEYFGYSIDPSRYAAGNGNEESTATVNFADNVLRPAINTSTEYTGKIVGGSNSSKLEHFICTNSLVKKYVREILSKHSISISKDALDILLHIIEIHIHCVLNDLKSMGPLTMVKIDKVFNNKKHAIFH